MTPTPTPGPQTPAPATSRVCAHCAHWRVDPGSTDYGECHAPRPAWLRDAGRQVAGLEMVFGSDTLARDCACFVDRVALAAEEERQRLRREAAEAFLDEDCLDLTMHPEIAEALSAWAKMETSR